jgi:hypothetical protein
MPASSSSAESSSDDASTVARSPCRYSWGRQPLPARATTSKVGFAATADAGVAQQTDGCRRDVRVPPGDRVNIPATILELDLARLERRELLFVAVVEASRARHEPEPSIALTSAAVGPGFGTQASAIRAAARQPTRRDLRAMNGRLRRWLLVLCLCSSSCDPASSKQSGVDCRPRKLARVQACTGEDHGFQECRFFFRARGVPQRAWCEAMPSAAPLTDGALAPCRWDVPLTWSRVACAKYNVRGPASCFACVVAEPEAARTYVYAYDAGCGQGIEQVTCNFDAVEAGVKLGPARL